MEMMEWEYAESFAPVEAAGLILGFNPTDLTPVQSRAILPVLKRMESDYDSAVGNYSWDIDGYYGMQPDGPAAINQARSQLKSVAMVTALVRSIGDKNKFNEWYFSGQKADFENQMFSRKEIHRWLAQNGLPTKYCFVKEGATAEDEHSTPAADVSKPLTNNERNTLLLVIAALAEKAGIDHAHRSSASAISGLVELLGAAVTPATIREKLDLIPSVVARREVVVRRKRQAG